MFAHPAKQVQRAMVRKSDRIETLLDLIERRAARATRKLQSYVDRRSYPRVLLPATYARVQRRICLEILPLT